MTTTAPATGSPLFHRITKEGEHFAAEHREHWSHCPWMIDVHFGDHGSEQEERITWWLKNNLGYEASSIHGVEGNWERSRVTMHGRSWLGFKTEPMMTRFASAFPAFTNQQS